MGVLYQSVENLRFFQYYKDIIMDYEALYEIYFEMLVNDDMHWSKARKEADALVRQDSRWNGEE